MDAMTFRRWLPLTIAAIACTVIWFFPAIPQDPAYHNFADTRSWLGIANFGDVMSNLPFALVGLMGAGLLAGRGPVKIKLELQPHYWVFFIGVSLVCLGSGYYHLTPNNNTLLWDRLPITLAFMGLFAAIIGERVSLPLGRKLLWPLVLVGLFSVLYWHVTEQQGRGDLRLYGLVQFLPIVLIPIILLLYPARYNDTRYLILLLVFYLLAKLTEFFDPQIYALLGFISGHSIKHLSAALGVYFFYRGLRQRSEIE